MLVPSVNAPLASDRTAHPHRFACRVCPAGSNFDDDRFAPAKKWRSEYGRTYVKKSIVEAKTAEACGVRSEQIC